MIVEVILVSTHFWLNRKCIPEWCAYIKTISIAFHTPIRMSNTMYFMCNSKAHLNTQADFNDVFAQMEFDVKANDLRYDLL